MPPAGIDNLKHVVVLMMENRSFDHMLGFAQNPTWPIDGLTGSETNADSAGAAVQVSGDANYGGDFTPDPGHAVFDTFTQLYGDPNTSVMQSPTMSGFVRSYEGKTHDPQAAHRIMKCFSAQKLPVLTSLAQKFCVCDGWFSSVPGPTFPNRAFVHGATSMGRVDMGIDWRRMPTTIFERLAQNNVNAAIFYHDSTLAMTFNGLAAKMQDYFGVFDDFLRLCENNKLPSYSFIEPRHANSAGANGQSAFSASDQHPDHDVAEGEALIQTVFKAIWGNPQVRNSTLLVIVYSCHGGFYDHVPPATTVNPDSRVWTNDGIALDPSFDFTRLGVRVPAILISPYIPAGTIDRTVYDHTSVIATVRRLLIPNVANSHLTQRDRLANTFEGNLTLSEPRNDALIWPAAKSALPTTAQLASPINDHLAAHVLQVSFMERRLLPPEQQSGIDPHTIRTESQAAEYLQTVNEKIRSREPMHASAKTIEAQTSVSPEANAFPAPKIVSDRWAEEDRLGYQAYARTLAGVITHKEALAPLTIGIKAPWGAGKTSLMKQVQHILDGDFRFTEKNEAAARNKEAPELTVKELFHNLNARIELEPLKAQPSQDGVRFGIPPRATVWFNAWKYQTSEQIWAGLAHCIISQVTARMGMRNRELFWLKLHARRVNKEEVRRELYVLLLRQLFPLFVLVAAASALTIWVLNPFSQLIIPVIGIKLWWAKIAVPTFGILRLISKFREKWGEKAADAFKDLVREPDYEGKMGFLYLVESDIRDVLDLVATRQSPLVIFVDDLDRCIPRKVAEVVEAINLSLCGDYPNCIFVLAMEPAMVAAALEVANKDIILRANQLSLEDSSIPLGWRFMEKIVQLPVIVPPPTALGVKRYMASLTGTPSRGLGPTGANVATDTPPDEEKVKQWKAKLAPSTGAAEIQRIADHLSEEASAEDKGAIAEASKQRYAEELTITDPAVSKFVESVIGLTGESPRQIKRYINVFRFYSTLRYNLRADSIASGLGVKFPTDEALAKFIALSIKWPHAADCLRISVNTGMDPAKNIKQASLLMLLEEKSRILQGDEADLSVKWLEFLKTEGFPADGWMATRAFRQFLAQGESMGEMERCGLW
jgi:phospholipase C